MRPISPTVYILASRRNGTLYTGVTRDLARRVSIHKQDLLDGFTKRYGVHLLVYLEHCDTMVAAIKREKQLKKLRRADKIAMIEMDNPAWRDLYEEASGFIENDDEA
jgi:putative endonuclease